MTTKNRIKKIEQAQGIGEKKKYLCVIDYGNDDKGYKVQSCFGGENIHFETRAQLDTFAARPEIDLQIVSVVFASSDTANTQATQND